MTVSHMAIVIKPLEPKPNQRVDLLAAVRGPTMCDKNFYSTYNSNTHYNILYNSSNAHFLVFFIYLMTCYGKDMCHFFAAGCRN